MATGSSSGSGRNSDGRSSQSRGSRSHGRSRSSTGSVDDVISSLFMLTNFQMQCSQRDGGAADNEESLPPLVKRDARSSSGRGRSSNSRSSNSRSSQSHGRSSSSTDHRSGARRSGGSSSGEQRQSVGADARLHIG